jgi:hypothetical protein
MRLYRLYNLSEHAPACGLLFFRRDQAEQYRELVKWPYANTQRWPLPDGREIPLAAVDLRVELLERDVAQAPELGVVVFRNEGVPGGAPLLPGDCFDPDEWQAAGAADLDGPATGLRWRQALAELKEPLA